MSHEVETMAFANEVPWHGLGNRVDPSVSVDEMLVAAGLDWNVGLHPIYAEVNGKKITLPTKRALVRDSDDKVLTITGDNWRPLQNRDALSFFKEYAEAGGIKLETAGSLKGGRLIWGLANLGTGFTVNRGRDAVKGYLLIVSPHEVGNAISIRTTTVRVVCANTMAMAMRSHSAAHHRQAHTKDFDVVAAREAIGLAREQIGQAELDAKTLNKLKLSEFDTVRFLATFFQPVESDADVKLLMDDPAKNQSKVLRQVIASVTSAPGALPGTGWGVMNGITHWADHVAGRNSDTRLNKAWFGDNARIKIDAQNALLEMAN
jgi:phage/plasmid-like protein (TIGR03299 family)